MIHFTSNPAMFYYSIKCMSAVAACIPDPEGSGDQAFTVNVIVERAGAQVLVVVGVSAVEVQIFGEVVVRVEFCGTHC